MCAHPTAFLADPPQVRQPRSLLAFATRRSELTQVVQYVCQRAFVDSMEFDQHMAGLTYPACFRKHQVPTQLDGSRAML